MSPSLGSPAPATHSFPRVSGDEPSLPLTARVLTMFSPRERG